MITAISVGPRGGPASQLALQGDGGNQLVRGGQAELLHPLAARGERASQALACARAPTAPKENDVNEAQVQSFWQAHHCGDHQVGGLDQASRGIMRPSSANTMRSAIPRQLTVRT
jgi:hypothetical protein